MGHEARARRARRRGGAGVRVADVPREPEPWILQELIPDAVSYRVLCTPDERWPSTTAAAYPALWCSPSRLGRVAWM